MLFRLQKQMGWQEGVIQSIANFMYQNRHQLAGAFRSFDLNNDGEISSEEFR
jgi:Ca2+-binding EF-hand superfamily protein